MATEEIQVNKDEKIPEQPKEESIEFIPTNDHTKPSDYGSVHTTLFKDPLTQKQYKIIANHTPSLAIEWILNHNKQNGFTAIILVGDSGTGKTTLAKYFVHQLHMKKNSVVISWFAKKEFKNLENIINGLTKGVDHIIVCDDISFILEEMGKEDLNSLMQTLTYIRHIVKGNVIVIMNIHYSKALSKFFRSISKFRYMTSISNEEIGGYEDVLGTWAKWKLRDFARMNDANVKKGWCRFEISAYEQKFVYYKYREPFGISLANEVNTLRFMIYPKESCNICDPEFLTRSSLESQAIIDEFTRKYGRDRVRSVTNYFNYAVNGIESLDSANKSLWKAWAELKRNYKIDFEVVQDIINNQLSHKRKRVYNKKKFQEEVVKDVVQVAEIKDVITHAENEDQPVQVVDDLNKDIPDTFNDSGIESAKADDEVKGDASLFTNDSNKMDYGFKDESANGQEQF